MNFKPYGETPFLGEWGLCLKVANDESFRPDYELIPVNWIKSMICASWKYHPKERPSFKTMYEIIKCRGINVFEISYGKRFFRSEDVVVIESDVMRVGFGERLEVKYQRIEEVSFLKNENTEEDDWVMKVKICYRPSNAQQTPKGTFTVKRDDSKFDEIELFFKKIVKWERFKAQFCKRLEESCEETDESERSSCSESDTSEGEGESEESSESGEESEEGISESEEETEESSSESEGETEESSRESEGETEESSSSEGSEGENEESEPIKNQTKANQGKLEAPGPGSIKSKGIGGTATESITESESSEYTGESEYETMTVTDDHDADSDYESDAPVSFVAL